MFAFREAGGVPLFRCRALEKIPGLRHGFSTRHGGGGAPLDLSGADRGGPGPAGAAAGRWLRAVGLGAVPLAQLRQTHSCRIHILQELPGQWNPPEGDALATGIRGIALGVRTADCLPVLVADPAGGAVAAVHCGWRGTLGRIAGLAVRAMQRDLGSNPDDLRVAIGPGIRSCCFEVGPEVSVLFEGQYAGAPIAAPAPGRPGKFLVDLAAAVRIQLEEAGVRPERIHDIGLCTCCNTGTFFSHRAGPCHRGRMMAVIGRV